MQKLHYCFRCAVLVLCLVSASRSMEEGASFAEVPNVNHDIGERIETIAADCAQSLDEGSVHLSANFLAVCLP